MNVNLYDNYDIIERIASRWERPRSSKLRNYELPNLSDRLILKTHYLNLSVEVLHNTNFGTLQNN